MGKKRDTHGTRYPLSPFFRRPQTFPLISQVSVPGQINGKHRKYPGAPKNLGTEEACSYCTLCSAPPLFALQRRPNVSQSAPRTPRTVHGLPNVRAQAALGLQGVIPPPGSRRRVRPHAASVRPQRLSNRA